MIQHVKNLLFIILGWISLFLGGLGLLLPLLPTTPFILLSAFFFSKGSEKIHQWLLGNKYFGKMILDWEKSKIIRKKAKIYATCTILPLFFCSFYFMPMVLWAKLILGLIGIAVLIFIWSAKSSEKT